MLFVILDTFPQKQKQKDQTPFNNKVEEFYSIPKS